MAGSEKFTQTAVKNILRHIEREIKNPRNEDIDTERAHLNYYLSPQREISSYSYYKQRKEQLYVYNRKDVIHMVGWIITAPEDLKKCDEASFFEECYLFMENRYGAENVVSAVVHKDESGQPHLHFCFMPVVADKKRGGEKLCCCEVMTEDEMNNFHPALQKHLRDKGINASVLTGVTKAQGGNRTVRELKKEREQKRQYTRERERGRWG